MASETNETREKSLNFLEEIIEESIAKGETRVQTRFPPEPNGYLHIGHAKSICINFGLAKKYGGKCNLRFDDTNPVKEDVEYVDSIKRDIHWLGFDWAVERYASDYFDQLYDWAVVLIKKGLAYVDDQTQEQIRENRGTVSVPGTPSPWRDRSVEENLDLFERMKKGEFADGEKVLRAKIDMAHPNMLFRDPIMYRIIHAEHHRTGDKWCIYPMYDYAHGQSDSIEQITHSICTLEFDVHRPLYDWFIQALEIFPSHQYEFARLNLTYTMMSKRKLLKLVQEGAVMGWDDPRMPTICALRRKGYTPASVRNFAEMVGVAKRDNVIDLGNSVPPAKYIEAAAKHNADIIACSALLTTTMVHIKDVVKGVAESPLAGKVKIMIGGAPVNDAFRESIGADYYTPDASSAAEKALEICAAARA